MNWQLVRKIIIPSMFQVICCLLFSFVLFGIIFAGNFGSKVLANVAHTSGVDQQTITLSYQQQLANISNNAAANAISLVVLIVGLILIVTLVLTSFRRTLVALKDEFVEAEADVASVVKMQTPDIAWRPIIKPLIHSAVLVGLVVLVFFSIQHLLPLWLALFGTIFTLNIQPAVVVAVTVAVTGLTINTYLIWTVAQIAVAMR